MRECPSCKKTVSEYASKCPNCGLDLSQSVVSEVEKVSYAPVGKASAIPKPNIKVIVVVCFAAVALFAIIYFSQPLHGDDKIAYDLIANNYYFQKMHDIEILSGSAGTYSGSNNKHASLTIAYTDSLGNRITGHYNITEEGVTNIQKAMDEAKPKAEKEGGRYATEYCILDAELAVSKFDDELNYEKITRELNR